MHNDNLTEILLLNFLGVWIIWVVYPLTSPIPILSFDTVYPVAKSTSMDASVTN